MAQLFANIRAAVDDLKSSWYFRLWAFFWIFCAIFSFAVLIVLAQRAEVARKEPLFHFWAENASTINFPRFRFRLPFEETDIIFPQDVECSWKGQFVRVVECDENKGHFHPAAKCQALQAEVIVAENMWGAHDQRIECYFVVQYQNATVDDLMVSFELEGDHIATYGPNSGASIWIAPNNNSWVLLTKGFIKFEGYPVREEWERELVYHSTVHQRGVYRVTVIINRFLVEHHDQSDNYNGWMVVGQIGGFGYFLVLLHTGMMLAVGICLNNDTKLFKGKESKQYDQLGGSQERANML